MTNAAQINSECQLCHDPEGGPWDQSLVGEGVPRPEGPAFNSHVREGVDHRIRKR